MTKSDDMSRLAGAHEVAGLAAQFDQPSGAARGTVLLVPPFGVSADNLFMPAYVLAQNGFRAVRFDPRDHVGRSEGVMYDFTISSCAADVAALLDAVRPDVVVGFSLAAPAVLRASAELASSIPVIMAAGVVNMRYTLEKVLGIDYFTEPCPDHVTVLGEDVNGARFIEDCRTFGSVGYSDTVAEGGKVTAPLTWVAGTEDPWVDFDEVSRFAAGRTAGRTTVVPVPVGTHQFNLNPTVALAYTKVVLEECLRVVGCEEEGVIPPLHKAISDRRKMAKTAAAGVSE